ncbi:MAG: YmdB family metallophosphoesterase, partial [Oscillospiraceae bacterium]|nr:YmdB family metallophosphoesterase [Oscillospiraceae bacterium]
HAFRRREVYGLFDSSQALLRPANYPPAAPGRGVAVVDRGRFQLMVINLQGVAFMEPLACPFETLDRLLEDRPTFCIVDFHAEATAEKKALAYYADGRVSAVVGTHTHVLTADEQVLPGGTGYITDIGMTGPVQSVLGVQPALSIAKMKDKLPVRFANAEGPCALNGVVIELDGKGKTVQLQRVIR